MIHFDVFFDFVNMKKGNQITPTPSLPSLSGHQDSNLGPPGPKPGTLPDCAIPRILMNSGGRGIRTPGTVTRTSV